MYSDIPNHMAINEYDGPDYGDELIEAEDVTIRFTDRSSLTLIEMDAPAVKIPKQRSVKKYTAEIISELAEQNKWSNEEILTYIRKYHERDLQ